MIKFEEFNPNYIDIDNFDADFEEDSGFESIESKERFLDYYYEEFNPTYKDRVHDIFELMYADQGLLNIFIEIINSKDSMDFEEFMSSLDHGGFTMNEFLVYMGFLKSSLNISMSNDVRRMENLYMEFLKAGEIEKSNKIINVDKEFVTELIESDDRFSVDHDSFERIHENYRITQLNILTALKTCGVHFPFINKWPGM